ncbi:molecular chaperone DnaJ [Candidatus Woesearchaeota archaeon CG10_big_fil_rev_8_21_14_0_10_45_16]|nr:MAG: molecular chaperone DnaJ [Candidatus Woesearchaeota archaeon CG10_big_fil_rev_8_21_14_0_10_45_16]
MARITIKGHEFNQLVIRDSYDRRAQLFCNTIIETLRKIGISEDDVDVQLQKVARAKGSAAASWYFDGHYMYFGYKLADKFVENLYIVSKVIELEVKALLEERITMEEFTQHFSEDHDIEKRRKEARIILGVPEDCLDLDLINRNYKNLAKKCHPDAGGDQELFKKINNAHKMLKRELS